MTYAKPPELGTYAVELHDYILSKNPSMKESNGGDAYDVLGILLREVQNECKFIGYNDPTKCFQFDSVRKNKCTFCQNSKWLGNDCFSLLIDVENEVKNQKSELKEQEKIIRTKEKFSVMDYELQEYLVPSYSLNSIKYITDVKSAIHSYFQPSFIEDMFCQNCHKNQIIKSKSYIMNPGEYLIISLNWHNTSEEKINKQIFNNDEILLDDYIIYKSNEKPKKYQYKLYAVIEHISDFMQAHYIAYIKCRENGKWFKLNDEKHNEIKAKKVFNCKAYTLFYEHC